MTLPDDSVPADYFEALYKDNPDPWDFASSAYERDKYRATLAAIGDAPIGRGLEIGCSIGVFTAALASRCAELVALDVAEAALQQARRRCAAWPRVRFQRSRVPGEWPEGRFDIVIFSEVLYFLSETDIRLAATKALTALRPEGRIVLVNWTGDTGHSLSGDAAAGIFGAEIAHAARLSHQERRTGYRLEIYRV